MIIKTKDLKDIVQPEQLEQEKHLSLNNRLLFLNKKYKTPRRKLSHFNKLNIFLMKIKKYLVIILTQSYSDTSDHEESLVIKMMNEGHLRLL